MAEERDWRLDIAEEPSFFAKFTWKNTKWTQTRDNWNHDHCEFCGAEISDLSGKDIFNNGWTTEDEYYWVCDKCFNDFKDLYQWNLSK